MVGVEGAVEVVFGVDELVSVPLPAEVPVVLVESSCLGKRTFPVCCCSGS